MENKVTGVTDKPILSSADDKLEILPYIEGLVDFIQECETPMSIAIQGDWGCGKTSTMNMVRDCIKSQSKRKSAIDVWFNTWQYSQFNSDSTLPVTFLQHLTKELSKQVFTEKAKNSIAKLSKTLIRLGNTILKSHIGIDVLETAKNILPTQEGNQTDIADTLSELKDEFQELLSSVADKKEQNNRVIIFIDDLDRLQPIRAVEILEILKIFLDCDNCIFVMAIDTSVVFQGIREKYGNSISDEKAQSFFDKMIQLPFKMPTTHYKLDPILTELMEFLHDDTLKPALRKTYIKVLKNITDRNPRTIKRLSNTILLNDKVAKRKHLYSENETFAHSSIRRIIALLSCLQLSYEPVYRFILNDLTHGRIDQLLKTSIPEQSNSNHATKLITDLKITELEDYTLPDAETFYDLFKLLHTTLEELTLAYARNLNIERAQAVDKLGCILNMRDPSESPETVEAHTDKEDNKNHTLRELQAVIDAFGRLTGEEIAKPKDGLTPSLYYKICQNRVYPIISKFHLDDYPELEPLTKLPPDINHLPVFSELEAKIPDEYKIEEISLNSLGVGYKYILAHKYQEVKFRVVYKPNYCVTEFGFWSQTHLYSQNKTFSNLLTQLYKAVTAEYAELEKNKEWPGVFCNDRYAPINTIKFNRDSEGYVTYFDSFYIYTPKMLDTVIKTLTKLVELRDTIFVEERELPKNFDDYYRNCNS